MVAPAHVRRAQILLRRSCFAGLLKISTLVPHWAACAKARYNAKIALPKPLWSLTMRKGSHFVALPSAIAPAIRASM